MDQPITPLAVEATSNGSLAPRQGGNIPPTHQAGMLVLTL
jgi:hypothetical protein